MQAVKLILPRRTKVGLIGIKSNLIRSLENTCEGCSKKYNKNELELDHIVPLKIGGDSRDSQNLKLLCNSCHRKKTVKDIKIISSFKRLGWIEKQGIYIVSCVDIKQLHNTYRLLSLIISSGNEGISDVKLTKNEGYVSTGSKMEAI